MDPAVESMAVTWPIAKDMTVLEAVPVPIPVAKALEEAVTVAEAVVGFTVTPEATAVEVTVLDPLPAAMAVT